MKRFNMEHCSIIERDFYNCLVFNFPQWSNELFGKVVNEKGIQFYFIDDTFKKQLQIEGWL